MMKKHVPRLICAILILSLLSTTALAAPFADIEGDYSSAIEILQNSGLVNGGGNNRYNPNQPMTLAELITILGRMAGAKVDQSTAPVGATADG